MNDKTFAVVLAGGSGTRFWPQSRHLRPKQLCVVGDGQLTMIEQTLNRLDGFIPKERLIVITHQDQLNNTKKLISQDCAEVIGEPKACNTAAALALASQLVKSMGGDSLISLHSVHVINSTEQFQSSVRDAFNLAEQGFLTLMGIPPTRAETGYGYIEQGDVKDSGFLVKSFREKPEASVAQQYLNSGRFLWNSGIFTWQVDTFLQELQTYLPNTYQTFQKLEGVSPSTLTPSDLAPLYESLQTVGVDNAILEVSSKVAMVRAQFNWYDIGSWASLGDCFQTDQQNNLIWGENFHKDIENCTIDCRERFVAAIGLKDICIVSTEDALLVCQKDRAQEVKEVVQWLKQNNKTNLI